MAWVDLDLTDMDGNSPFDTDLLADIHNNQEELVLGPYDHYFDSRDDNQSTWTLIYLGYVYFPPAAALTVSPIQWVFKCETRRLTTSTYYVRARLAGGSWIELGPFTNGTYATRTFTFPDVDVKAAAAAGESTLEIEMYKSSGIGFYRVQNHVGTGRLELEP